MTTFGRLLGVLLLVTLAVMATALPASAHTEIDPMSPQDGVRLSAAPETLEIGFSDAVAASDLDVRAEIDGEPVPLGSVTVDGHVVRVAVGPGQPPGSWLVQVTAAGPDGHPVHTGYAFVVGDGPLVTVDGSAIAAGPDAVSRVRSFLDLLVHLGVLLPAGGLALLLTWRGGLAQRRTLLTITAGAAVAAEASVAQAVLHGAAIHGDGLGSAFMHLDAAWLTPYGRLALVRAVAVIALAALLVRASSGRRPHCENGAITAGVVVVLSLVASSHLVGAPLGLLLGMVHVGAICLWLGGLVLMGTSRTPPPPEAWSRWTIVAPWCFGLAVLTGVASVAALTTAPPGPARAAWWSLLLLKMVGVATAAALALVARSAVRASASSVLVRRAVVTEAVVGLVAVAGAVGLASTQL
jgi:methionine-rich copper-binding protein CopC/putative copper export protein